MLSKIIRSLKYRKKMSEYGIFYIFKNQFDLSNLKVRNQRIRVAIPESEKETLGYELYSILINDCYHLSSLDKSIKTVLDVGANIGLFTIAASYYFPNATIHAYEPNPRIESYLEHNCLSVKAKYFLEAIGLNDSWVNLNFGENSLHTITSSAQTSFNTTKCTAFNHAIKRLSQNGKIDLVKLDCEGVEWQLFEDIESWSKVRFLTMEYHLWAEPGYSLDDLFKCFEKINFSVVAHQASDSGQNRS